MITRRQYQDEALRVFVKGTPRSYALLLERQAGKSTVLADTALLYMMKKPNRTCVYGSASLLLGTEITLKQQIRVDESARDIIERDSAVIAGQMSALDGNAQFKLATADASTGKEIA